jgi:Tol biopolymer transport system component/tetratricopeptide (TPR) repeat protein
MRTLGQRFPSWALWISGAITLLAVAMLILAIVLGVRAGQQQLEIKRRQQLSLILQQAFEFHNAGQAEAARIAYEEALLLDPDNLAAVDGLNQLRSGNGGSPAPVAVDPADNSPAAPTATAAPATATVGITPPVTPTADAAASQLAQAQESFAAGRWSTAITQLQALRTANPTYAAAVVDELLFDAYVNLATEKDNQNKLQEALSLFDAALAIDPSAADIRSERNLIDYYIDAITYAEADWAAAATALQAIYDEEPDYRDVKSRLQTALRAEGERLADDEAWCAAADTLSQLIAVGVLPGIVAQRDVYQEACAQDGTAVATITGSPTPQQTETPDATATTPNRSDSGTTGGPTSGTILYSAYDATSGRIRILSQAVSGSGGPTLLREDAAQPALRQDGERLLYRNLRDDMAGISAWDPGSNLLLRFTQYAEDSLPSWGSQSNQFVFASNREGDRIWRIYVAWAESNGEASVLSIGEAPAWHPSRDLIVFRGCDNTGNRCGLWQINSRGGDRTPLTDMPTDNRPSWSPDGRYAVFMSDGRTGNFDIFRVDVDSGEVLPLVANPALDLLPTVSPDGRWVAFLSNRENSWQIWAVPLNGGNATMIAPVSGNLGSWTEQSIQWAP